ncbi:MAG: HAD-IIIC family phosphatase [SAR324 cluster bacterium]|nr:HAD-IIIC family phosphatase [SAR324 cluster bacterium]
MESLQKILSSVSFDRLLSLITAIDQVEKIAPSFKETAKINFLRNFTIEGIDPFLKYYLYREKIQPQLIFGNYDNVQQEILDPQSHLHQNSPDAIVLALMPDHLSTDYLSTHWDARETEQNLLKVFDLLQTNTQSLIIVNTFIPPFYSEQGVVIKGDKIFEIQRLNQVIRQYITQHSSQFFLADWERFVRVLGEEKSMDYRYWYMSKAPFKKDFLQLFAFEIVKIIRALKGKSKKCLVLDCDNTLWGGILGEDGINGIKLDPHDYPGKTFYDFQQSVLHLIERGVMIALCSKNNEQDVWDVLNNHPSCLLKPTHLSAWKINWDDKASNISALAKELNIGLDSFVFMDDSPMECDLVRSTFPMVTVVPVPKKLFEYPSLLFKDGWFDTLTVSLEDKHRNTMYQIEVTRNKHLNGIENLNDYLSNLELVAIIHPMTSEEIQRVSQLTQKTNQFNLTTKRYSEIEIKAFANNSERFIFTMTVEDKFGPYGLTGIFMAQKTSEYIQVDSFLMSCRILGRNLECAFVDYCMSYLENQWGMNQWKSFYIPTPKNHQVANFWEKFGFKAINCNDKLKEYYLNEGEKIKWELDYIKMIKDKNGTTN